MFREQATQLNSKNECLGSTLVKRDLIFFSGCCTYVPDDGKGV